MVNDENILLIVPDQSLNFSAAEHFKGKIFKHINRNVDNNVSIIVIDGHYVQSIDITVAKVSFSTDY